MNDEIMTVKVLRTGGAELTVHVHIDTDIPNGLYLESIHAISATLTKLLEGDEGSQLQ